MPKRHDCCELPELTTGKKNAIATGARGKGKADIQVNWGRMQQNSREEDSHLSRFDRARRRDTSGERTVLERFEGFVDEISGDTAFVTLKSEHGDILHGKYSADALGKKGIFEQRRFRCLTIECHGKVEVSIEAIPDVPVSAQEEAAIRAEIDKLLGPHSDAKPAVP